MKTLYVHLNFSTPFLFKNNPFGKPEIPANYESLSLSDIEFTIPGIVLGLMTEDAFINQLKLEVSPSPKNTATLQGIIQGSFTVKDGLDPDFNNIAIMGLGLTIDFTLSLDDDEYHRVVFSHRFENPPEGVTLVVVKNKEDLPEI